LIIDFEGETARTVAGRRRKQSPLRDVAGMLRSFQRAAYSELLELREHGQVRPEEFATFEPWGAFWAFWAGAVFWKSYLDSARQSSFLPAGAEELQELADMLQLDQVVSELRSALRDRPEELTAALTGLRVLLKQSCAEKGADARAA
jgi:maltose alpha-D-glucosyltransferase/alpha-amylase